ncbi:hypothetical protein AK812_SmicGene41208 [Symbiodinium microadriaticum]|uniref:Uncharacterized protein n=1 Tax=Symbiodinium microadriaticum TaxID=2951 RepID=A0A1Q9C6Q1_SYMMI|nr:hypothetical protein AK812_SmicGene41208 [Symbiodinium microadriaticum]
MKLYTELWNLKGFLETSANIVRAGGGEGLPWACLNLSGCPATCSLEYALALHIALQSQAIRVIVVSGLLLASHLRYKQFLVSVSAGGGDVGRRRDCISLSEIIQERLTEINADSFVWTKTAAGSAFEDLGQSQSGSSTDRHPRSPVLPPQQPVAEALDQPDEECEVIAPAAPVTPPRPLPLSELHRYDSGLVQVTQWFERVISLGFRYLLALDQHKVADRNVSQTRDIVRAALAVRTIVVVCSFIPDSSFLSHGRNAQALWNPIIADIAEYPCPLPIIVTSKPLYRWGKASCLRHLRDQLWHQQQASFDSWVHVDDRLDIVREIDAERGLRGVHWDVRDRRSLLELCRAEGVL